MAVEGDISDLDLTNVIQMLCTDRKSASLTLNRRGEEGVILVDRGEVVHATLGPLVGEDAVYQLLTWHDGRFRIAERLGSMTRTIDVPWRHLILEAMRVLDESRRDRPARPVLPRSDGEGWGAEAADRSGEDDAREERQMLLLSHLEHGMARMGRGKKARRAWLVVEELAAMVDQVTVALAEEGIPPLVEASLARIAERRPLARLISVEDHQLSVATLAERHRDHAADPAEQRRLVQESWLALADLLASELDALGSTASPASAERWRESYQVFLRDLAQVIDRLAA